MTKPTERPPTADHVVEMDAMDVHEWEHGQNTPQASDANLAALVKQSAKRDLSAPVVNPAAAAAARGPQTSNNLRPRPSTVMPSIPSVVKPAAAPVPSVPVPAPMPAVLPSVKSSSPAAVAPTVPAMSAVAPPREAAPAPVEREAPSAPTAPITKPRAASSAPARPSQPKYVAAPTSDPGTMPSAASTRLGTSQPASASSMTGSDVFAATGTGQLGPIAHSLGSGLQPALDEPDVAERGSAAEWPRGGGDDMPTNAALPSAVRPPSNPGERPSGRRLPLRAPTQTPAAVPIAPQRPTPAPTNPRLAPSGLPALFATPFAPSPVVPQPAPPPVQSPPPQQVAPLPYVAQPYAPPPAPSYPPAANLQYPSAANLQYPVQSPDAAEAPPRRERASTANTRSVLESRRVLWISGGAIATAALVVALVWLRGGDESTPASPSSSSSSSSPAPVAIATESPPTPPTPPVQVAPAPGAAAPIAKGAVTEAPTKPAAKPPVEPAPKIAAAAPAERVAIAAPKPARAKPARRLGGKKLVVEYTGQASEAAVPGLVAQDTEDPAIARARTAYVLGNQKLFSGDAAGAIDAYRQSLSIYPGYVGGYRGLGLAYALRGEDKKALDAFQTYVTAAPGARDIALIKKRMARLQSH